MMIIYAALMAATVVVAAYATGIVRDAATRRGLLDMPNERSSHVRAKPRTGGVGIMIAAAAGWTLGLWLPVGQLDSGSIVLAAGSLLAGALGFVDDTRHLEPHEKLLGQLAIALPAVLLLPVSLAGWPIWLTSAGAILWILTYTNMFNFMDGSDGLAAGVSVIAGIGLAIIAWGTGEPALAWLSLSLAAAGLGFLRHNAAPASIFMGDSGSFFLGYAFAVLALLTIKAGARPIAVLIVLYPFLFDATVTLLLRVVRAEPFWRAHRQHLYQRLLIAGWSHEQVARRYYLWQALAVACGLVYEQGDEGWRAVSVVVAVTAALAHLVAVSWEERRSSLMRLADGTGPGRHPLLKE